MDYRMDCKRVNIVVSKNVLNEILEKWNVKREIETFKNCNSDVLMNGL
jgi:hypothetical protein